jgi:hypothetical protein
MTNPRDEQMAFALMPTLDGKPPILAIGIPVAAWARIKTGEAHTIDLTKVGLPVRVMLFGALTHDTAVKTLMDAAKANGIAVLDERRRDFSIEPGTGVPKR